MERDMHEPVPSPLRRTLVIAAAASAFLFSACQSMQPMTPQKSVYDRLGGQPAITAVVDDFVGNVAADNRINGFSPARTFHDSRRISSIRFAKARAVRARTRAATCARRT